MPLLINQSSNISLHFSLRLSKRLAGFDLVVIGLTVLTAIFHWLWFLSWFLWYRVATNENTTEPKVPSDKVEVDTMNWLTATDVCVKIATDMLFVVITIRSCPHSYLSIWLVARVTWLVPLVETTGNVYPSAPAVFTPCSLLYWGRQAVLRNR
jgi:hypothetical protein